MNKLILFALAFASSLLPAGPSAAHTADGCATYTWDLARELAAMESPPQNAIAHAHGPATPPNLVLGTHYRTRLQAQATVHFPVAPGRARKTDEPTAGIVGFKTGKAGRYRVALTSRHWIDIVIADKAVDSLGHEGRGGCPVLHKVVEFDLPAGAFALLQFSGGDAQSVDFVITGPV